MRVSRIAVVVEGDGERRAAPVLIRRIAQAIDPTIQVVVPEGFRHPSGSMIRPGGLERAVRAAAIKHPNHAVLVLLDCDDDCPAILGPKLLQRLNAAGQDLVTSVVLVSAQEFESWFLAACESLAGKRDLQPDLMPPPAPESIRNAKGWLSDRMLPKSRRYAPTQDQEYLAARFDLQAALARSPSFHKLWREITRLMTLA